MLESGFMRIPPETCILQSLGPVFLKHRALYSACVLDSFQDVLSVTAVANDLIFVELEEQVTFYFLYTQKSNSSSAMMEEGSGAC